jgi:hypothetical protein
VIVVALLATTILFFGTNRNTLTELKISSNHFYQAQAQEAARGGLEYGLAYLAQASSSAALTTWTTVAGGPAGTTQRANSATQSPTIGAYAVTVSFWQNPADLRYVTVQAVAQSGDASATAILKVKRDPGLTFNQASSPPWVVNGCINFTSAANQAFPVTPGGTTFISGTPASCSDTAKLDTNGGSISWNNNIPSAWDYIFGTSKSQLKALASAGVSNIYYFDSTNTIDKWQTDAGSPTAPVIIVFDTGSGCADPSFKINGNPVIWGIVYLAAECSASGFGGLEINGLLLAEAGPTGSTGMKVTANTTVRGWVSVTDAAVYNIPPSVSRIPGSWRNF